MLHLLRWIKHTTPRAIMAGTILFVGVSGCRSLQELSGSGNSPATHLDSVPSQPVPLVPGSAVPYDENLKPSAEPMLTIPPQADLGAPAPVPTIEDEEDGQNLPRATVKSESPLVPAKPVPMPAVRDVFADPTDEPPRPPKVAQTDPTPTAPKTKTVPTVEPTLTVDTPDPVITPSTIPQTTVKPVTPPTAAATVTESDTPTPLKLPAVKTTNQSDEEAVPAPTASDLKTAPLLPDFSPESVPSTPKVKTPATPTIPEFKPIDLNAEEPFIPAKITGNETKPESKIAESTETKTVAKPATKPVEPQNAEFAKTVAETDNVELPVVVPGPVTAKVPVAKLPEPIKPVPQVSARVTAPVDTQTKSAPLNREPAELLAPDQSLLVSGRVLLRDVAEFETAVDNLTTSDDGTIFVSHRQGISRISPNGRPEVWARTGAPRGHAILSDGMHIISDVSQRAVLKLNQQGYVIEKLAVKSDGYFLRAPHDLIVDSEGGVYFADPGYARIRNPIGQVHYISGAGKVNLVMQKLAFPDGLALSPDGTRLYVVESQKNQLLSFDVLGPGRVGPKRVLATLKNDADPEGEGSIAGLSVDDRGRLYVAHRDASRIEVLDADGRLLTTYSTGRMAVADVVVLRGNRPQLLIGGTVGPDRNRGLVQLLDLPSR